MRIADSKTSSAAALTKRISARLAAAALAGVFALGIALAVAADPAPPAPSAPSSDQATGGPASADQTTGANPASADEASAHQAAAESEPAKKELFRGKVVLLREALNRRGIKSRSEFDGQVVLETPEGELIPIVPDWRGRAFFQDERLRNRKVELVGIRKPGIPYLQVLMIFTFDDQGHRQYTDYWCDICSIPMYEIKPCECCQGEVRLRFQPGELPDYIKP